VPAAGKLPRRVRFCKSAAPAASHGRIAWPHRLAASPGRIAWPHRLAASPGRIAWPHRLAGAPALVGAGRIDLPRANL